MYSSEDSSNEIIKTLSTIRKSDLVKNSIIRSYLIVSSWASRTAFISKSQAVTGSRKWKTILGISAQIETIHTVYTDLISTVFVTVGSQNINWVTLFLRIKIESLDTIHTDHAWSIRYTVGSWEDLGNRLANNSDVVVLVLSLSKVVIHNAVLSSDSSQSWSRIKLFFASGTSSLGINLQTIWILSLDTDTFIQVIKVELVTDITTSLWTQG